MKNDILDLPRYMLGTIFDVTENQNKDLKVFIYSYVNAFQDFVLFLDSFYENPTI